MSKPVFHSRSCASCRLLRPSEECELVDGKWICVRCRRRERRNAEMAKRRARREQAKAQGRMPL